MPVPTCRERGEAQKKVVRKDQLRYCKESINFGCVSQDSYPRKFPHEKAKIGINAQGRSPWAPKFGKESH